MLLVLCLAELSCLAVESLQDRRSVLVTVLVRDAFPERLYIGDRRDSGLDQSMVRCFQALLGWEFVLTPVEVRGVIHLYRPPPLKGKKDRPDGYLIVAASGHRLLEPLAECILALLELIDLLLQAVADALDARERPLAGEGSQASLAGERALASIERMSDDLQEKIDQFEEREDALRERFQDAMA